MESQLVQRRCEQVYNDINRMKIEILIYVNKVGIGFVLALPRTINK